MLTDVRLRWVALPTTDQNKFLSTGFRGADTWYSTIQGIDKSGVYMSPDGLIRYQGVDIVYNTYPCNNQYLAAISADLCPVLEGQDCKSLPL